jgi:hypothetical protein
VPAAVSRHELDPDRSQVWIEGSSSLHPIRATASGLTGFVELALVKAGGPASSPRVAGEVRIEVDRLRSRNPVVDRETRRRIDAPRHPLIIGTAVSSERVGEDRVALEGDIELRGVTQRVSGELTVRVDGGRLVLEGSQRFDVRDWGLQPPRLGLVRVHPHIDVRVRLVGLPTA